MKSSAMLRLALLVYVAVILALYFTKHLTGPWWSIAIAVFLIGSGVMDIIDPRVTASKLTRLFSRVTLGFGIILLVLGIVQLFL